MFPDEKYRAFMLGIADAEFEANIEEAILDGRLDPGDLEQIEEELIDDLLFGRLSKEEERSFRYGHLSTPRGAGKLAFAVAMQHYAARHAPGARRRFASAKLRELAAMPWVWSLAGALGCAVLAAIWLGARNLSLSHQLAQATLVNDEHQRLIASMLEEQRRLASLPVISVQPPESKPVWPSAPEQVPLQSVIRLSPGVSRGLATVPVLHLNRQAKTVSIVLELPFDPASSLREELLDSENKSIWTQ